jgi:hypothetical protein
MTRFNPVDLDLDDHQLHAIGYFATQWAFFETEMAFTISALGVLVEGDRNMPQRFSEQVRRWRKLASAYYPNASVVVACEKLIDTAIQAHARRSDILHGRIIGYPKKRLRHVTVTKHRHLKSGWHVQPYTFPPSLIMKWGKAVGTLYWIPRALQKALVLQAFRGAREAAYRLRG